jgi:hypothetical protein
MNYPTILLDSYTLSAPVLDAGESSEGKAIYIDRLNGSKVFVKFFTHYRKFLKEKNNYIFLETVTKLLNKSIIRIPKLIYFGKHKTSYVLVTQYISGTHIKNLPAEDRATVYIQIINFFQKLSNVRHTNHIARFPPFLHIVLLQIYTIKCIVHYPKFLSVFLKGYLFCSLYVWQWITMQATTISHGDLNNTNVLKQNNFIILLDYSNLALRHTYYDLAQSLNSSWEEEAFYYIFTTLYTATFQKTKQQTGLIQSFVIYNLLSRLQGYSGNTKKNHAYIHNIIKLAER